MAFADALAQIKSQLGGETREKKSAATLGGMRSWLIGAHSY